MRNIPAITKNLLIINIIAFFALYVFSMRGVDLNDMFGLHFFKASHFHLYQFVTYMFCHAGFTHLFFNMFALWMFGMTIESVMGPKRFLTYYMVCGIGAGIVQELVQLITFYAMGFGAYEMANTGMGIVPIGEVLNSWTTVGASGAVYGVLLAFGMIFPNERIFIFPIPVPIRAKWFICIYIVIELFSGFAGNSNVAHFAHLGGMLFGFLLIRYWQHGGGRNNHFFNGRGPIGRFFRDRQDF